MNLPLMEIQAQADSYKTRQLTRLELEPSPSNLTTFLRHSFEKKKKKKKKKKEEEEEEEEDEEKKREKRSQDS